MRAKKEWLGLRHVALNVSNLGESVKFYQRVLGLELEWQPDDENAYLTSGGDNLALHKARAGLSSHSAQPLDHIGFAVRTPDAVDQWARRLEVAGVTLSRPPRTHRDGARSFYFPDPDGNLIQIIYHPPITNFEEEKQES